MDEKDNKRSFRVRMEHKLLMLEESEENPILIMQFSQPNSRRNYIKSWVRLTQKLNALGYGEKSQDKWRRVLTDWLSATKSKYSKIKRDQEKTGGEPHDVVELISIGFPCVDEDGYTQEMGLEINKEKNATNISREPSPENLETITINIENENLENSERISETKKLSELRNISNAVNIIANCLVDISNILKSNNLLEFEF